MSLCLYVCGEERENPCISVSFFLFSVLHLRSLISAARDLSWLTREWGYQLIQVCQAKWNDLKTRFCWTRDSYSPITEYFSTLKRQISTWRWNHRLIKDRRLTFKTDRTFRVSCPSDESGEREKTVSTQPFYLLSNGGKVAGTWSWPLTSI